jgi:hypothetical protein
MCCHRHPIRSSSRHERILGSQACRSLHMLGAGTVRALALRSHFGDVHVFPQSIGVSCRSALCESAGRTKGMAFNIKEKSWPGWLLMGIGATALIIIAIFPLVRYIKHHHISWLAIAAATAGVVVIAGFGLVVVHHGSCNDAHKTDSLAQSGEHSDSDPAYPRPVEDVARRIKAILQMAIGIYAVGWLGWTFLLSSQIHNCAAMQEVNMKPSHSVCYLIPPGEIVFRLIADALAASTVIELAFTLFTPGPDEALDPVLLAVAAALLFQLGKIDGFKWQEGAAIAFYSVSLGILFVVRVFLASGERDDPKLWWWINPRVSRQPRPRTIRRPGPRA